MPTDVAVLRNLTFTPNGGSAVDLQDWPRIFLEVKEGGPDTSPETRGGDQTVPYRTGQVPMARRKHRLAIMLAGSVAGVGADESAQRADTAEARQELKAAFEVDIGEGVLSVDTEDGVTWTINARPEVFLPPADPVVPTFQTVSVRLVAVDPPEWEAAGS